MRTAHEVFRLTANVDGSNVAWFRVIFERSETGDLIHIEQLNTGRDTNNEEVWLHHATINSAVTSIDATTALHKNLALGLINRLNNARSEFDVNGVRHRITVMSGRRYIIERSELNDLGDTQWPKVFDETASSEQASLNVPTSLLVAVIRETA